ncbi:sensor histidine kinase [Natronobiforma cellulositropha]|uniref:sensor histidine kinase n=1 Tax=Natronobiforma cellulositropha TaxID=1679076 RepID=UPI0021D5C41B|nr:HAMP domain-containing sensor histidine kinase [Natronobiforma cellulositropha]
MNHRELVGKFSQTVGIEKAESLVEDALDELAIDRAETYTHHELADICETIQHTNEGYVRLVANEIHVYERAQQRFDALLDEITDPIVTVTFEDSVPIIRAMNPAFEEAFDCGSAVVGRPLTAVIDAGADRSDVISRWFRSDHHGGIEVHHRTDDGIRTFLFRSIVVTRQNGDVEGYAIYTDITDRKHYERQLERQNEQLERFASVVSHDLRNPLTIAEGNLELALDTVADPTAREHLRRVSNAHRRMSHLIEDLLALARQGQTVDSPEPVSLERVISEAWSSVSTTGVCLEVETDARVVVDADPSRLRQLFENLFRNSVEHGRDDAATDGGDDSLVTVRVGLLTDGRRGFFVEDDGTGIAPENRADVFEHGYSTRTEGTGFGLAIVKTIADAHEWSITATESADGGARFEIGGVGRLERRA